MTDESTDDLTLYCTVEDVKMLPNVVAANPQADLLISSLIRGVSRQIDQYCAGRSFFKYAKTRYFDVPNPYTRQIDFEIVDYLLEATTLTNGDGTVIDPTDYNLIKRDGPPYFGMALKQNTTVRWLPDSDNNTEAVIALEGYWGMCDRQGADPRSVRLIEATKEACRFAAYSLFTKRFGKGIEGIVNVTAAGVVVLPSDLPPETKRILDSLLPAF